LGKRGDFGLVMPILSIGVRWSRVINWVCKAGGHRFDPGTLHRSTEPKSEGLRGRDPPSVATKWLQRPVPPTPSSIIRGMKGCPDCELALDLERHAKLVAREVEDLREAERLALTPDGRRALREDEALLQHLLDRIAERRYSLA
jgi:hypothetical protein